MGTAAFSRTKRTVSEPKKDVRLDVPIDAKALEDFRAMAQIQGLHVTELARELISNYLYGNLQKVRMAANGRFGDGTNIR